MPTEFNSIPGEVLLGRRTHIEPDTEIVEDMELCETSDRGPLLIPSSMLFIDAIALTLLTAEAIERYTDASPVVGFLGASAAVLTVSWSILTPLENSGRIRIK